ncbi:aBC transporter G family member 45 isoform X1 [Oryza sativa Japonica Group]|uniref:aBC transporter G family member 45 isoform X1 n=1 Tax=Oryza sativa subsp. japonica TaxID=39947 RepID=UPI000E1B8142|nr:ABC transporter G family member 45 isoform X2 [Oryza sativa Japonica Group]XP_052165819.1 ABC transporter G family member 45 isoform X2 [Oryza glaberrima]
MAAAVELTGDGGTTAETRWLSPPLTHDDNRGFLQMLREKKERLGVGAAKVEVRLEKLTVEADVRVGRRAVPTLLNCAINAAQELAACAHMCTTRKKPMKIINEATGTIRPSRMTLLLGAPGSGKTTLLKALAGKLDSSLKMKGKVTYNGEEVNSSTPQYLHAYVSQYDLHHAEMTVRETIDFSSKMLGTNNEFEMLGEAIRRKKGVINRVDQELDSFIKATTFGEGSNLTTNYIIKILGLSECADTLVGDEMRRGISGGQKKRATIGEMLVGLARCFFMDDISTGLDSSTTFEIMKFLQQMAHLMDLTMVISLLQPPPETLELFDDIILLCEGQIVYHGPRENATDFFETMGFKCPSRKNVADFLQEVTSKMDQKQYWIGNANKYQYHSIEKFAESFRTSYLPRLVENDHFESTNAGKSKEVKTSTSRMISSWNIFKACFSREVLLLKRNSPVHIFKTIQITVLALVISTLFLRTNMRHDTVLDANKYMGALFMAVVIVNFNGMTEIAMTIKRLPIFYKQREILALPGWALLSSVFLLSLPISFVETGLWTGLTYYVIGYAPSFVRFIQHFVVLFAMHQMSMSLYRFLAAIGRTQVMANMLGTAALIAIYILGGFVISKDNLQPWLRWGYWTSPFTYAQNAVALNEFLDDRWATEFHFANANTVGETILKVRGLLTEWHWYWICVSILFGFSLVFNILSIFALQYMRSPHKHQVNINATKVKVDYNSQIVGNGTASTDQVILPFQPLSLVFDHINYFVDMPKEMTKYGVTDKKLQLLQDVSGAFRPGVLTALMGITGAGKTTLLDVLAGRKTGGYIEGTVKIAGYPKKQETFSRISGYCEQSDIHSPNLTVYESLQFSAWLRLPSNVKSHQRNMFIDEVMDLVELTGLKNAMVGLAGATGLSAEQRKRLTIAVELVASPSIIFMDEPTTGLDARAAAIVMRTVRKTVDTGRTVVCTIHQPSIEIFESFDELLLMKRGGQLIYSGSLGPLSSNMIKYFEAIPGVPRIKEGQNPAAWMLDISSRTAEYEIGVDYAEIYQRSSLYWQLIDDLGKPEPNTEDLHFPPKYWQDFRAQCMACLWKQNCAYWKNSEHNVVRFINTFAVSIMFGIVFWKIGSTIKDEQDVFNILGVVYGSALFLGFMNCSILQPVVGMERVVLYREKAAGMYSTMAYAIAQVAVELPYMFVQVFIFSAIVYPMIGFQMTATKFFWFALYMVLSFLYYTLYGMMTVALTPNIEIAAGLSFLIFIFWNVFSGFIIGRQMIPVWWRWVYWANPAAWTVYGLMFSQLGDRTELIQVPGQPEQTVKEFLEGYLGLQDRYFNLVTSLHVAIIALFTFLFFLSIKHLKFQRR